LILRIKHVLQFGKYFNASFQEFFRSRFVFGSGLTGIVRIDILEPKLLAIGDAIRGYKFLRSFDDFFSFRCRSGVRFIVRLREAFLVLREAAKSGSLDAPLQALQKILR
jgi:hypothetical protein